MSAPVAIIAIGNRSRGDDAAAPMLLDRLRAWLSCRGLHNAFALVEEYQLQVENALDLEGRRLALFVDASLRTRGAVTLEEVVERPGRAASHALEPAAVLDVFRRITGASPPAAFVMGLSASGFELGASPSARSVAAMREAWPLLQAMARDPRRCAWLEIARECNAKPDRAGPSSERMREHA